MLLVIVYNYYYTSIQPSVILILVTGLTLTKVFKIRNLTKATKSEQLINCGAVVKGLTDHQIYYNDRASVIINIINLMIFYHLTLVTDVAQA